MSGVKENWKMEGQSGVKTLMLSHNVCVWGGQGRLKWGGNRRNLRQQRAGVFKYWCRDNGEFGKGEQVPHFGATSQGTQTFEGANWDMFRILAAGKLRVINVKTMANEMNLKLQEKVQLKQQILKEGNKKNKIVSWWTNE